MTAIWRYARPVILTIAAAVILGYAVLGAVVVHLPVDMLRDPGNEEMSPDG